MKLGFIDHHLNNYHANKFHGLLTGMGHEIVAAYESNPEGEDWCQGKGVPRANSAAEVVEKAEAILVIAPDNVDSHLELARPALASGKPVFLDKLLADKLEDAREIARLAKEAGTPIFCASSLRFSVEIEELLEKAGPDVDGVFSRGLGPWRGYATHTVYPALRLFGFNVKRLIDTGKGAARIVTLEDDRGRRALLDHRESENQYDVNPWQLGVLAGENYHVTTVTKFNEFYENLMKRAAAFFESRISPVAVEEMLMAVAIECAAEESLEQGGQWVEVHAW